MYEPDLAQVKRAWAPNSPKHLVLPDILPDIMLGEGYRLQDGALYWNTLRMSDMSTRGTLLLFREYLL